MAKSSSAEVNLHERLMFADEITIKLDLLDHFVRCSHQGGMTGKDG
jgi:hypothetical protein